MKECADCARLEARIKELEAALAASSESSQEAEDRLSLTIKQQNFELRKAKEAERESEDRQYWRAGRLKELERAREFGDLIEQDRIIQQLKRGW